LFFIVLHCFAAGDFPQIRLADANTGGGLTRENNELTAAARARTTRFSAAAALLFHCY
jgi:hypothetical protein